MDMAISRIARLLRHEFSEGEPVTVQILNQHLAQTVRSDAGGCVMTRSVPQIHVQTVKVINVRHHARAANRHCSSQRLPLISCRTTQVMVSIERNIVDPEFPGTTPVCGRLESKATPMAEWGSYFACAVSLPLRRLQLWPGDVDPLPAINRGLIALSR